MANDRSVGFKTVIYVVIPPKIHGKKTILNLIHSVHDADQFESVTDNRLPTYRNTAR